MKTKIREKMIAKTPEMKQVKNLKTLTDIVLKKQKNIPLENFMENLGHNPLDMIDDSDEESVESLDFN